MGIYDRGYRDKRKIGVSSIETTESGKRTETTSDKLQTSERFRYHLAVETTIVHLKNDHRMLRNYHKGQIGEFMNLFVTCAVLNLWKFFCVLFFGPSGIAVGK